MPEIVTIRRTPDQAGDLVGAVEAAGILNVERTRVARYVKTGVMPEPVAKLRASSVWLRSDVEELARARQQASKHHRGLRRKPVTPTKDQEA